MRRRILIADGNPDTADSLAVLLRIHGHEVTTAYSGPDALAAIRTADPDTAFLALFLPGLDGYEVARRLRDPGNGRWPGLLVALTGYGTEEDRHRVRAAGFDHHLIKPADPADILALLG
jgi:CheY-like chemotaxis protein